MWKWVLSRVWFVVCCLGVVVGLVYSVMCLCSGLLVVRKLILVVCLKRLCMRMLIVIWVLLCRWCRLLLNRCWVRLFSSVLLSVWNVLWVLFMLVVVLFIWLSKVRLFYMFCRCSRFLW